MTLIERLAEVRACAAQGEARRLREEAGLSLAEMGQAVGVDASTIGRWERGLRVPRTESAIAYGRVLDRLRRRAVA